MNYRGICITMIVLLYVFPFLGKNRSIVTGARNVSSKFSQAYLAKHAQYKNFSHFARYRNHRAMYLFGAHKLATRHHRKILSPRDFKGLDKVIHKKYKYASLLHGVPFIEVPYIERMYFLGPEHHKTIQLVKMLFHVHGNQLRTTQNKSLAAYALNGELMGELVGLLSKGALDQKEEQEKMIECIRSKYKEMCGTKISYAKVQILIQLIVDAHKEGQQGMYHDNIVFAILQAFVHRKAQDKKEAIEYVQGLQRICPESVIKYKEHDIISTYTDHDYEQLQQNKLPKKYEDIIFMILQSKNYKAMYPPKVFFGRVGYNGQPKVPNCCEQTLEQLFREILNDPVAKKADISALPSHIQPNPELSTFFQAYGGYESVNKKETEQAWMNVISGKNFKYRQKDYELRTRYDNFIHVMNCMLNINVATFQELGVLLSTDQRKINFETAKTEDGWEINGSIVIPSLHYEQNISIRLCNEIHAYITFPHEKYKRNVIVDKHYIGDSYHKRSLSVLTNPWWSNRHRDVEVYYDNQADINHYLYTQIAYGKEELLHALIRVTSTISGEKFAEILPQLKFFIEYSNDSTDNRNLKATLGRIFLCKQTHKHIGWVKDYIVQHNASMFCDFSLVSFMIDTKESDINALNDWGETYLHYAVRNGHTDLVRRLCEERNVNVNIKDTERKGTPLHYAVQYGYKGIVEILCKHGADVNVLNKYSKRPLDIAEDADIIEVLKKYGAIKSGVINRITQMLFTGQK